MIWFYSLIDIKLSDEQDAYYKKYTQWSHIQYDFYKTKSNDEWMPTITLNIICDWLNQMWFSIKEPWQLQ